MLAYKVSCYHQSYLLRQTGYLQFWEKIFCSGALQKIYHILPEHSKFWFLRMELVSLLALSNISSKSAKSATSMQNISSKFVLIVGNIVAIIVLELFLTKFDFLT